MSFQLHVIIRSGVPDGSMFGLCGDVELPLVQQAKNPPNHFSLMVSTAVCGLEPTFCYSSFIEHGPSGCHNLPLS